MNVWDELGSSDTEDPSTIKMQSESIDREINNTQLQDGLEPLHTFRPLRPPPPRSFLDPKGDLCVEVGIVPTKCFTVCSRTLARTSLFWNKMLYGEFKESKKACPQDDNLEWIVKLPDDNSTAMGLLLHIAHGLFDVVPSYEDLMNIRDLYEISIITDKYDMTHILQPWARGWLRSITQYVTKLIRPSLREQYCHERLWISWELGDKANFEEIAKVLLLNSTISANDGNGLRCAGVFEPPDIYDIIEQTRLDTIKALLAPLHNIIQRLITNHRGLCRAKDARISTFCMTSMLGMGIQSLHNAGLWPIPQPAEILWSVSVLSEKLYNISIESISPYPQDNDAHECSQGQALQVEIEKVLCPRYLPSVTRTKPGAYACQPSVQTYSLPARHAASRSRNHWSASITGLVRVIEASYRGLDLRQPKEGYRIDA